MRLKILIIALFLVISSVLFPNFEFEILPKLGFTTSFTDLTGKVLEAKANLNLQLGYNFSVDRRVLRGFSLLFDFGIDESMLSIAQTNEKYKLNQIDSFGIYTGLSFKFILNGNPNSIMDAVLGIASGVKFIPIIDDLRIKPNKIPFSPYVRLSLEDRIYTSEKMALVVGLDIFYEYMFFDKADRNKLFVGYSISQYHSIGFSLTLGMHFGRRQ